MDVEDSTLNEVQSLGFPERSRNAQCLAILVTVIRKRSALRFNFCVPPFDGNSRDIQTNLHLFTRAGSHSFLLLSMIWPTMLARAQPSFQQGSRFPVNHLGNRNRQLRPTLKCPRHSNQCERTEPKPDCSYRSRPVVPRILLIFL